MQIDHTGKKTKLIGPYNQNRSVSIVSVVMYSVDMKVSPAERHSWKSIMLAGGEMLCMSCILYTDFEYQPT